MLEAIESLFLQNILHKICYFNSLHLIAYIMAFFDSAGEIWIIGIKY